MWGTAGAVFLRVILIIFALTLLKVPYLKLVGALLLLWIGIKLLMPEDEDEHANIKPSDKLWGAVKTVIVADLVMSVDNVIAIAGAAQGAGESAQLPLVIFGLLVSIPIIVWGSQLVLGLMTRLAGAATTVILLVTVYFHWVVKAEGYRGAELSLIWSAATFYFALRGAGRLSLDALLRRTL